MSSLKVLSLLCPMKNFGGVSIIFHNKVVFCIDIQDIHEIDRYSGRHPISRIRKPPVSDKNSSMSNMDTHPWPLYISQNLYSGSSFWVLEIMTSLNILICLVIFLVLVYGKQDDLKDMCGSRQCIMQVFHTWISGQSRIILNLSFQITLLTVFIYFITAQL